MIAALLSLDNHSRKIQRWPLYTIESLTNQACSYEIDKKLVAAKSYGKPYAVSTTTNAAVQENLFKKFPLLQQIFEVGGDNLIAAGGSVVEAMRGGAQTSYHDSPDVDLFVYGEGVRTSEQGKVKVSNPFSSNSLPHKKPLRFSRRYFLSRLKARNTVFRERSTL